MGAPFGDLFSLGT